MKIRLLLHGHEWLVLLVAMMLGFGGLSAHGPGVWGPLVLLSLIGAGCWLVIARTLRGLRAIRLLRRGFETEARLISKDEGDETTTLLYEYWIGEERWLDAGNRRELRITTSKPDALEDEGHERMLYDPLEPDCAMLLDEIPGAPRINSNGELECTPGVVTHLLVLPVATIALALATLMRALG